MPPIRSYTLSTLDWNSFDQDSNKRVLPLIAVSFESFFIAEIGSKALWVNRDVQPGIGEVLETVFASLESIDLFTAFHLVVDRCDPNKPGSAQAVDGTLRGPLLGRTGRASNQFVLRIKKRVVLADQELEQQMVRR